MLAIAVKIYVDKCWVYEFLVCYDNKLKDCRLGKGRYNIDCDLRYNVEMVDGGCELNVEVRIGTVCIIPI